MRAFVTGGTGFVGGRLVRRLRRRGDEVVALVRSPAGRDDLARLGCRPIAGDLGDLRAIREGVADADAVFHVAANVGIGAASSERAAMLAANVGGTERVLDEAARAGVPRVVYCSTMNVHGNTGGRVVDETAERRGEGFTSYYDRTKYLAHLAVAERIAAGAPVVVAEPGGVYGSGDPSVMGTLITMFWLGRIPFLVFPNTGFNFVHVDDVADGLLLAHDRGEIGRAYALGGELTTIGGVVRTIHRIAGRRAPRLTVPDALLRASAPLGPVIGRAFGLPPNLRELLGAIDGVTYWVSDARARRELGYAPRDAEAGLRQTLTRPEPGG